MEIRKTLRHLTVLGVFTLGLPACTGEVVDPDEEKVGQANEALCGIDWECDPPPPPPPSPKPDLVVLPSAGGCLLINPYTVRVTVKNTGVAWAKASKTGMNFWAWNYEGNLVALALASTPALNPGETATVDLYQPTINCEVYGCSVIAYADWSKVVAESNESNNSNSNEDLFCY